MRFDDLSSFLLLVSCACAGYSSMAFTPNVFYCLQTGTTGGTCVSQQNYPVSVQYSFVANFSIATNAMCGIQFTFYANAYGGNAALTTPFILGFPSIPIYSGTNILQLKSTIFNKYWTIYLNQSVVLPPDFTSSCIGQNSCTIAVGLLSNSSQAFSFFVAGTTIQVSGPTCNSSNCTAFNTPLTSLPQAWGDSLQNGSCIPGYQSLANAPPQCYCSLNGTWNCTAQQLDAACSIIFVGCPAINISSSVFSATSAQGSTNSNQCSPNWIGISSMQCQYNNTWNLTSFNSNCTLLPTVIGNLQVAAVTSLSTLSASFQYNFFTNLPVVQLQLSDGVSNTFLVNCNRNCTLPDIVFPNLIYGNVYALQVCIVGTTPLICGVTTTRLIVEPPANLHVGNLEATSVSLLWDFNTPPLNYSWDCNPGFPDTWISGPPVQLTGLQPNGYLMCKVCTLGGPNCSSVTFITPKLTPTLSPTTTTTTTDIPTVALLPTTAAADNGGVIAAAVIVPITILLLFLIGFLYLMYRLKKANRKKVSQREILLSHSTTPLTDANDLTVLNTTMIASLHLPGHLLVSDFTKDIRLDGLILQSGESTLHACTVLNPEIQARCDLGTKFVYKRYPVVPSDEFLCEVKLLNACAFHSHIVHILGYVADPSHGPGLLMPLYQSDLRIMRRWFLDHPEHVIHAAQHLASALSFMHALPMAHGDLKPGNILVQLMPNDDKQENASPQSVSQTVMDLLSLRQPIAVATVRERPNFKLVVSDFGTAYCELPNCSRTTRSFGMTLAYAAPERVTNDFSLNLHSLQVADIYSFGIILTELVLGTAPYDRLGLGDIKSKLLAYEPPFAKETLNARLTIDQDMLRDLILTATNTSVNHRQSAEQIGRQIASYLTMI